MTGMFQSSRIASGNPSLQTSSAFSPSSASMIRKSRPSRMRLATFRMTLESSTTRHVLISASTSSRSRKGRFHLQLKFTRQTQKAAGALDGVNQAENVIQDPGVVGILLEPHQLIIDCIQAFAGFRQELPQQLIHETGLRTQGAHDFDTPFQVRPASMQSV